MRPDGDVGTAEYYATVWIDGQSLYSMYRYCEMVMQSISELLSFRMSSSAHGGLHGDFQTNQSNYKD